MITVLGFFLENNRTAKLYLKQALLVIQKLSPFLIILLEELLNNVPFLAINDSLR